MVDLSHSPSIIKLFGENFVWMKVFGDDLFVFFSGNIYIICVGLFDWFLSRQAFCQGLVGLAFADIFIVSWYYSEDILTAKMPIDGYWPTGEVGCVCREMFVNITFALLMFIIVILFHERSAAAFRLLQPNSEFEMRNNLFTCFQKKIENLFLFMNPGYDRSNAIFSTTNHFYTSHNELSTFEKCYNFFLLIFCPVYTTMFQILSRCWNFRHGKWTPFFLRMKK